MAAQVSPEEARQYRRANPVGSAQTCQKPLWDDGLRPTGADLFCGKASEAGYSYCPDHVTALFVRRVERAPRVAGPARLHKGRFMSGGYGGRGSDVVDIQALFDELDAGDDVDR